MSAQLLSVAGSQVKIVVSIELSRSMLTSEAAIQYRGTIFFSDHQA